MDWFEEILAGSDVRTSCRECGKGPGLLFGDFCSERCTYVYDWKCTYIGL